MATASSRYIEVVISADYELFHGRNFLSPRETLFDPTERLFQITEELGAPLTLFADVCSVAAYKRHGIDGFIGGFEQQLVEAIGRGHDVQLHLHAHWSVAVPHNDGWRLAERRVTLPEFGFEHPGQGARKMLSDGRTYLEALLQPGYSEYRCVAYRAGGLALQPQEREQIAALLEAGIIIDSSLAKGYYFSTDSVSIDYRNLPDASNWFMSPSGGLNQAVDAGLFEVPIPTFRMEIGDRIRFLVGRVRSVRELRGASLSRAKTQSQLANAKTLLLENLRYLNSNPAFLFSADTKGFDRGMLVKGFKSYINHCESRSPGKPISVSMINHPKLLFERQLVMLRHVLCDLRDYYGDELHFVSFREIAARLAGAIV